MGAERERQVGIPLADFVRESMENFDAGAPEFQVAGAKDLAAVVDKERFAKTLEAFNKVAGFWETSNPLSTPEPEP